MAAIKLKWQIYVMATYCPLWTYYYEFSSGNWSMAILEDCQLGTSYYLSKIFILASEIYIFETHILVPKKT